MQSLLIHASIHDASARGRSLRLSVLAVGLVLEQFILFGPSLIGSKILLPLDVLRFHYLPNTAEYQDVVPRDNMLLDLVVHAEPFRQFAASEFRAGRLPLWIPDIFAGTPLTNFWKYSPFALLYYLWFSPNALAWMQLIKSLVAGVGAYLFFRRVLRVRFWPATIGAWCYPVTGFLVLWQGFELSSVVAWYPWVLLCTDSAIRRPRGYGGPGLAIVTALTVFSGIFDVAAQVILASAFYAGWCLIDLYGKRVLSRPAVTAAATAACGWLLGYCIAAPYVLPMAEYGRESPRLTKRAAGVPELTPDGWAALPEVVLPRMYGTTQTGSIRIVPKIILASSAVAYTGLLATLLVAPLAWCSRRHRSLNIFWAVTSVVALGWLLNIPGLMAVFRLPGLNVFSHYRWVFLTSFAILALAVTGLEVIWQGQARRRWWFALPAAVVVTLGSWCVYRATHLPEPVATQLRVGVETGHPIGPARDLATVERIQHNFRRTYVEGAILCGLAVAGWLLLWSFNVPRWFGPVLGMFLLADLLWFAYDVNPQSDPKLYYPRISVLETVALSPPGRILGVRCLPPDLNLSHGLRDIRGYDGVDPARFIDLLEIARDRRTGASPFYAATQWYVPNFLPTQAGQVRVSPVLDMLNVRYLIFRGRPHASVTPFLQDETYWVLENASALPRAYVPRWVETVADGEQALHKLAAPDFDPRQVAYVEGAVGSAQEGLGTAEIIEEVPSEVTLSVDMQTAGLVVLSDRWDAGWRAYLNGKPAPLLRVNYTLRGVEVGVGHSRLVFRYEPASFTWGVRIMGAALLGVLLWAGGISFLPPKVECKDAGVVAHRDERPA